MQQNIEPTPFMYREHTAVPDVTDGTLCSACCQPCGADARHVMLVCCATAVCSDECERRLAQRLRERAEEISSSVG